MKIENQESSGDKVCNPPTFTLLKGFRKYTLLAYNIILFITLSFLLINFIAYGPDNPILGIITQSTPNLVSNPSHSEPTFHQWFVTLFTLFFAGGLAGILRNFHGYHVHIKQEKGLPAELEQNYYLRPLTGALLGLMVLFLGNLITSSLTDVKKFAWITTPGMIPYIGIAILAGFSSQEFIGRMKAVAVTLFGEDQTGRRDEPLKIESTQ